MKTILAFTVITISCWSLHAQSWRDLIQKPNSTIEEIKQSYFDSYRQLQTDEEFEEALNEEEENEDGEAEKLERWLWLNEPRADENGYISDIFGNSLKAETALQQSALSRSTVGDWEFIGPTNVTKQLIVGNDPGVGRVNCLAYHDGSNTLFAGAACGGLWKRKSGNPWTCITNFIPNLAISGIAVNPDDEYEIYILTGDGDGAELPSNGVLKTKDGGQTWYSTGLKFNNTPKVFGYKLLMHPQDHDKLYAATNIGIWITEDGGANWTQENSGDVFYDIEFRPDDPSTMYMASDSFFKQSSDGGHGWYLHYSPNAGATRCAVAVSPNDPEIVYFIAGRAYTQSGNGFLSLTRIWNLGYAHTLISDSSDSPNILGDLTNGGTYSQATYDLAMAIHPSDADKVMVGGINAWKSDNGGSDWAIASHWADNAEVNTMHADIHDMQWFDGILYVANDGGVFYWDPSVYSSPTWTEYYDGLGITTFYRLGADYSSVPTRDFFGAQDNGTMVYEGSDTWQMVWGGDGGEAVSDFVSHDIYYFCMNEKFMKQSCNACVAGGTSPYTNTGNIDDMAAQGGSLLGIGIRPILMDPDDRYHIIAGFNCLYETIDAAGSWDEVDGQFWDDSLFRTLCEGGIYTGVTWTSNGRILATKNKYVLGSPNPGDDNWYKLSSNLSINGVVTGICASPTDPDICWVTMSNYADSQKVFMRNSQGAWINVSGSLPNVPAKCIVHEGGSNNGLYVGTDIGVFYRNDDIGDWIPFRNGMPSVMVSELEIKPGDNLLYAATYGRGAWRSPLYSSCPSTLVVELDTILNVAISPYEVAYSGFEASNWIEVTAPVVRGEFQLVETSAGDYVDLKEGFEVKNSSEFHAQALGCGSFSAKVDDSYGYYAGEMQDQPEVESLIQEHFDVEVKPNPFPDAVDFTLTLNQASNVSLQIADVSGHVIDNLIHDRMESGVYQFNWGHREATGVYLLIADVDGKMELIKLVKVQ